MKFTFLTALLLSLLSLKQSYATESIHSCNVTNCSNPIGQARKIAEIKNPGERFSIVSVKADIANSYQADLEFLWGEPFVVARKIPTSTTALQTLNSLKNLKEQFKNIPDVVIPADVATSAFDLILVKTTRIPTANAVYENLSYGLELYANLLAAAQTLGFFEKEVFTVTALFSDGTTFEYEFVDFDGGSFLVFERIEGSGVTVEKAKIPENAEDFIGTHILRHQNTVDGYAAIAVLFGLGHPSKNEPCVPKTVFECTEDADGKSVCTTTIKKCD